MSIAPRHYTVFILLLLLLCADRWRVLDQFTFRYVCDDQAIGWRATKDYSEGKFHEPYFYGQPYNPMPENFVALLLTKAGVAYNIAVPLTMTLFSLTPFILLGIVLLRKQKYVQASIAIAIPLLLPNQYTMIASIGNVSGTLFAGFAIIALFSSWKLRFFFFGLMGMLAMFISPNAAIVLFPAGLVLLLDNYRNRKLYYHALAGAIPVIVIWMFCNKFYEWHPDYVVHGKYSLEFSLSIIKPYEWDKFFNYVTPLFWNLGWLVIPLLLILAVVLFRQKEKSSATALVAGAVLIFFSLTIIKVHDGTSNVFYSWARMFMSVPLVFAVFLAKLRMNSERMLPVFTLMVVAICYFLVKWNTIGDDVHEEVIEKKPEHNMYIMEVEKLHELCDSIARVARDKKTELIVVGNHDTKHLVNYGCPCLVDSFPRSIEPADDRRTWLLKDEETQTRSSVLFVSYFEEILPEQMKTHPGMERISGYPAWWSLDSNNVSTGTLLDTLGIPIRCRRNE